ncbi:MAG: hypothetical protein ACKO0W_04610 [Planctomycetota bacterium]
MNLDIDSPENRLAARLDRIERSVRYQRRIILALGGALCLGGMLAAGSAINDLECGTLTCRQLLLVDAEQRPRVELATDPEGHSGFRLLDKEGRTRLIASTLGDGSCLLTVRGMKGGPRAGIGELGNGTASVCLFDPAGKPQFDASVGPDGQLRVETAQPAPERTSMSLEQAKAELELAYKAYRAEEERVQMLREFQSQTTPLLAIGNQAWKEAPQINPEVTRRYFALRALVEELEGR